MAIATGTAILGAAAIGAAGAVAGGIAQKDAAKDAAEAQKQGTLASIGAQQAGAESGNRALVNYLDAAKQAQHQGTIQSMGTLQQSQEAQTNFSKWLFEEQKTLQEPWQQAGLKALDQYAAMPEFSFTYNDLTADPSYAFRQQEAINALDKSAAARGRLLSGGQDRAITRYASDLASQEYSAAYGRAFGERQLEENRLSNLIGVGQNATNAIANAQGTMGANIGNTLAQTGTNIANLQQSEGAAQANILGQQGSGIANIAQGLAAGQASAYGSQGTSLANIYQNAGQSQANMYGGIASAANTGISNYMLMNYLGK